jgi:hypothetical protein
LIKHAVNGFSDDGRPFIAEAYFVAIENERGTRMVHNVLFRGCDVRQDDDGFAHFVDVRRRTGGPKMITTKQYKLDKSRKAGWTTAGLNLAPAFEARLATGRADLPTLCPKAGVCAAACLKFAGMNQMTTHAQARVARTVQLLDHWEVTIDQLIHEISRAAARAPKGRFAFRPNLLSDLPKLAHALADALPALQFYDYTKLPKPWLRTRPNYHLTFSYSERSSWAEVEACLAHGINVAVVFNRVKGDDLPTTYRGVPIIDGDVHDLRFLDPTPALVGLRFKGARAKLQPAIAAGFVLEV